MSRDSRRSRRWVLISVGLVVISLFLYAGWIAWLYSGADSGTKDPSLDDVIAPIPQEEDDNPFFALLVGSDSREGLSEEEQERLGAQDVNPDGTLITGERADALILVRVDPAEDRLMLLQLPRDLYVTFPDGTSGKINGALDKGRRFLVETVESLSGLGLNRYAQVNIAGFRDVVDALGGVDVCIAESVPFDRHSGFELDESEVGMVHLDGEAALRYARTRYVLPGGDFDRIANQQKLLAAAIQKAATVGTLLRPDRVYSLFGSIKDSVKTDSYSSLQDLRSLAGRFRELSTDKVLAYVAPNKGSAVNEAGDVVLPAKGKMDRLFSAMSTGEVLPSLRADLAAWEIDIPVSGAIPKVCR